MKIVAGCSLTGGLLGGLWVALMANDPNDMTIAERENPPDIVPQVVKGARTGALIGAAGSAFALMVYRR